MMKYIALLVMPTSCIFLIWRNSQSIDFPDYSDSKIKLENSKMYGVWRYKFGDLYLKPDSTYRMDNFLHHKIDSGIWTTFSNTLKLTNNNSKIEIYFVGRFADTSMCVQQAESSLDTFSAKKILFLTPEVKRINLKPRISKAYSKKNKTKNKK